MENKSRRSRRRRRSVSNSESSSSLRSQSRRSDKRPKRSRRSKDLHWRQRRNHDRSATPPLEEASNRNEPSSKTNSEVNAEQLATANTSRLDSDNFMSILKDFVQSIRSDGNAERYPAMNVIPDFDPSRRNQTISMWLSKVNECVMKCAS
ncbi:unnamed protein product [Euphydryas editha]|uniref:Uncharacterized protein n=1 Tax=Euphydryas editha TaxID=104508 RepID=A0AAU9TT42_EUPED|nr:unnamed protein product [Euphydryas editha]